MAALARGSEGDRTLAASRLYHQGQGDRGVPLLAAQLRAEEPGARCLAARLLGLLRSPRAIEPLSRALNDPDWAVRRDAAEALGQIGETSAARYLARRLEDPHPRVRIAAARSLRELGATSQIPEALEDEGDAEVRLHLVEALGRDRSRAAERALRGALDDESELVRNLAASYLVERGDLRAVEVLAARLTSESATARREGAEALGRATGPAAAEARRLLEPLLRDPSIEVGLAAAVALNALGDPRGLEHLRALARSDAPPALRARALELLDRLAPEPDEDEPGPD